MKYQLHNFVTTAPRLQPVGDAKHAEDGQCPDAAWHPLSRKQKARLAILARQAASRLGLSMVKADLDAWRREQSVRACGRQISEALQENWADLKSAFEDLAGQPEKAFATQLREGDNKRRVAMHKLVEVLRRKELPVSYAAGICATQFKTSLEQASAKQLWCLFYTLTNRKKG